MYIAIAGGSVAAADHESEGEMAGGAGICVLISATIEMSQLITMRGLFEWDDMIHNGLGCMVGAVLVNWMIGFFGKRTKDKLSPIPPTGLWRGLFFYILKEYYFRRRK